MLRKLSRLDFPAITAFGTVFFAVLSQLVFLWHSKSFSYVDVFRLLSFAALMASLITLVQDARTRLMDLKEVTRLASLGDRIADIKHWTEKNANAIHVRAVHRVVETIASHYMPNLIKGVNLDNHCRELSLADHSPIHELMHELASKLPDQGIWLGITWLEDEAAWSAEADQQFSGFAQTIRNRAAKGNLKVLRLYKFSSESARERMLRTMAGESTHGIQVRDYVSGNQRILDISLLYKPRDKPRARKVPHPAEDLHTLDKLTLMKRLEDHFEPVCALEYTILAGRSAQKVEMFSGEHERFGKLVDHFATWWQQGTQTLSVPVPAPHSNGGGAGEAVHGVS
jgi:hypothetical protein